MYHQAGLFQFQRKPINRVAVDAAAFFIEVFHFGLAVGGPNREIVVVNHRQGVGAAEPEAFELVVRVVVFFNQIEHQLLLHGADAEPGEVGGGGVEAELFQRLAVNQVACLGAAADAALQRQLFQIGGLAEVDLVDVFHDVVLFEGEFAVALNQQETVVIQGKYAGIGIFFALLHVDKLLHFAAVGADGDDAGEGGFVGGFVGIAEGGLHDADKGFAVGCDGEAFHAAVGAAVGIFGGQGVAVASVVGEGVDAADFDAFGVVMDDVRAVFVADPEGAVGEGNEAFAVEAVFVKFGGVGGGVVGLVGVSADHFAIEVVGDFVGAAEVFGIGQTADFTAVGAFERDGFNQLDALVGIDFKQADGRGVVGCGEDFTGAVSAFDVEVGAAVGDGVKAVGLGRVAGGI